MDTVPVTNSQNAKIPRNGLRKLWSLLLVMFIILGFLVYSKVSQTNKKPVENGEVSMLDESASNPLPTLTPAAEISIEPELLNLKIGSEFNSNIAIDTLEHGLTAIRLVMQFQPDFITVTDIIPGDFFVSPTILFKKIDNVSGTVRLDLGVIKPVKGSGVVAKLTGIALKKTEFPTSIAFSTDTAASEILPNGQANPENILTSYLTQDVIIEP